MEYKNYFKKTFLQAFFVAPLMVSATSFFIVTIVVGFVVVVIHWLKYKKGVQSPEKFLDRCWPVLIPFVYYMLAWIMLFAFGGYTTAAAFFALLGLPFFILNFILLIIGEFFLFPLIVIVLYGTILFTEFILSKKDKAAKMGQGLAVISVVFFGLAAVSAYQYIDWRKEKLPYDHVVSVGDEVKLYEYKPFSSYNKLYKMTEEPTLTISSDYPRLDGATAAYPVYGAMVEAIYKGLDEDSVVEYVDCNTTPEAYANLIEDNADIIFAAEPSKEHLAEIKALNKEFALAPIAKEAFVFFVNKDNPVDGLTVEQIQDIYTKEITNWKEVGGADEKIMPFQRPVNSGSQTVMLAEVMKGKQLPEPLMEEYVESMGGIISRVAAYRNYSSAIGYSFRFYTTGMKPNDDIKLLAIDGVEPTVENIRSGKYPFTVNVYAVTTGNESENTKKLIDWILSDQGQRLIENCGYVSLR